jgi:hypothetical protein
MDFVKNAVSNPENDEMGNWRYPWPQELIRKQPKTYNYIKKISALPKRETLNAIYRKVTKAEMTGEDGAKEMRHKYVTTLMGSVRMGKKRSKRNDVNLTHLNH